MAYTLVRIRREEVGMTQAELCKRTGIRQPLLSKLENGHRRLRVDQVAKIARALGIPPSALIPHLEPEERPNARRKPHP